MGVLALGSVLVNPHVVVYDVAVLAAPLVWLGGWFEGSPRARAAPSVARGALRAFRVPARADGPIRSLSTVTACDAVASVRGANRVSQVEVRVSSLLSEDDVPVVLIFVVLAALALLSPAQADTWTHLRTGREIWTTGAPIGIERFSFTSAGVPWYNHEWLSQVLFYGVYALGGPPLLTLLTAGCAFIAVLTTWRTMRGGYESRLALLALLVVLLPAGWAVRPQALSLLLLVVALQLAMRDRLEWLPPMMVIWANAHGVVLFGVLIAIGAAVDAVVWSHDRRRRAIVVAVLCVAAPLVSPLGWHYWPRVAQTVSESRLVGIQEFRSGFELAALPFWGLFVALGVAVVRRARTLGRLDKADRQMAMLALVMGVASAISIRNAPFFALVAAPALSRLTSSSARQARRRPAGVGALALLVLAVVAGGHSCRARVAGRWGAIGMAARQPNGGACDPILSRAHVQHLFRRGNAPVVCARTTSVHRRKGGGVSRSSPGAQPPSGSVR